MESLENYLIEYDYFINSVVHKNFYYVSDKEWLKQQAHIIFLLFYEKYRKIYKNDFKSILDNYFHLLMFHLVISNIEDLVDYKDKVSLSIYAIYDLMKYSYKYPNIKEISEWYNIDRRVAYSIMTYAFEELDIEMPKSRIFKNREIDISDEIIDKIDNRILINRLFSKFKNDQKKLLLEYPKNEED